jgi:uncharacterized protein (TIGR02118 family)
MVIRIVCFNFKKEASGGEMKAHMDDFASLAKKIPQIKKYSGGRALSGEHGAAPEYACLHYMLFDSMEDVDVYFEHPEHKKFIERNRNKWESKVFVLNAKLD